MGHFLFVVMFMVSIIFFWPFSVLTNGYKLFVEVCNE